MLLNEWIAAERGRGAALARHLKLPASMVTRMAAGNKPVPLDHCPAIADYTAWEVSCEELRPDKVEYFAMIRLQNPPRRLARPGTGYKPARATAVGEKRPSRVRRDDAGPQDLHEHPNLRRDAPRRGG